MKMFKVMYEKAEYKQRFGHYRSRMDNNAVLPGKHPKIQKRESNIQDAALKASTVMAESTVESSKTTLTLPRIEVQTLDARQT